MADSGYDNDHDTSRPVAYDANGQPLYAAPQASAPEPAPPQSHVTIMPEQIDGYNYDPRVRVQYANEPNVVHSTRSYAPHVGEISPEVRARHDDSARRFPDLNLSEGEYVIMSVKRHAIGLWTPMIVTVGVILLLIVALVMYPSVAADQLTGEVSGLGLAMTVIMALIVLVGIGGYIAVWIYQRNTFYLTNESVIQEIQHSLFSKNEQTVSLGSIEDASFRQSGIIQTMFNYGTIRLSTEGEETTYRFHYVTNPKFQIATISNAIESFKNGRPVEG